MTILLIVQKIVRVAAAVAAAAGLAVCLDRFVLDRQPVPASFTPAHEWIPPPAPPLFRPDLVSVPMRDGRRPRAAADGEPADGYRERQRAEARANPAPPVPPGDGEPLARLVRADWRGHGYVPPPAVDDRAFIRRACLDLIGLPPTPEELAAFTSAAWPDKRERLVDALLSDDAGYAEHWMTFWNDLLRNDDQESIANQEGQRTSITPWLFAALIGNEPLDRFVSELLNPGPGGPDGYLKGVNWRGRVNASQTPPVQAAQNVAQVFLACSVKCASCHDSFTNRWKLADAYGLASFFSPVNLELHRCESARGTVVPPRFLFPGLGEVPPDAPEADRRRAIAHMVTRPNNPRFPRAVVNRYWKRLLGRGLVEPSEDFETAGASTPVLDWLADDFVRADYDAKHLLRRIVLSPAYELPVAAGGARDEAAPSVRPPRLRRLTAEQYLDAVAQVSGFRPDGRLADVPIDSAFVRAWRYREPGTLARALGRPHREQVCAERDEESSVLQALELTNGAELADRVRGGAALLLKEYPAEAWAGPAPAAVERLWLRGLGRRPNPDEFGPFARPADRPLAADVEDLLWVLYTHPEFNFIY